MSILRQLKDLRSLYSRAGIRVAAEMYEVFSTQPADLSLWKQVPTLEEAVALAKQLVQQHEGSVLNVWHSTEGQVYQVENQGGRVNEVIAPRQQSKKDTPMKAPMDKRPWDQQMGEYWQKTADRVDMGLEGLFWMRLGDGGEYTSFGDIQELEDELRYYDEELGIGPVTQWTQYGFLTPEYKGNNYISIYFGDEEAQPLRELSPREKYTVEKTLEGVSPVYAKTKKAVVEGVVYRPVATPRGVPEGLESAIRDAVRYYDDALRHQQSNHPDSVREIVKLRSKTDDLLKRVQSGRMTYSDEEVRELESAVKKSIDYLEGAFQSQHGNITPEHLDGLHAKRRRLDDLLEEVSRMRRTGAAEAKDDVGFPGFVKTLDEDKKMPEDHHPEWILETMRETREEIPEVTDEEVVKVHG